MIYSKEHQCRKNRVDKKIVDHKRGGISQKRRGAISPLVRSQVKERSNGLCEVRKRCTGAVALHMAHLQSRNTIEETKADMIRHACYECHSWLDFNADGIRYKKQLRGKDAG